MGSVTYIEDWKRDHPDIQPGGQEERLERAVERLDAALRRVNGHPAGMAAVESELLAITGAVSIGMLTVAADRAEALADRLDARAERGG
jgi:broad specificity phosphatase PhoE